MESIGFCNSQFRVLKKIILVKIFCKVIRFLFWPKCPKKYKYEYLEILLSEIPLLGHEKLRKNIEQYVIERMIEDIYKPMLEGNKIECGLCHE